MPTPRRHDLDALRVGAFLLLILYHIGMLYVPWDWHVKSDHILPQLQLPMGLVNPWRLTLLFVISGAATRFMADKFPPGTLARQRSVRLLVPLLFGMIVVVPPQSWIEVIEKTRYTGGYLEFWLRYLSFDQSFGMFLPTYNHLWFVAYLWIYTILALAIWSAIMAWERRFPLTGAALFFLPVALFGLYRAFLFPHWPETHIVWRDVYAHMHYGTAFLVGIVLAKQADAWALLGRWRHRLLAATLCITAVGLALSGPWERQADWRGATFAFIREGLVWCVICTLFGYVHYHIRKGSPLLSTLTEAVFPFYIVHQTTIVVVGYTLKTYDLPVGLEASVVLISTAASCVAAYWGARRLPLLRLALGLKPQPAG